MERKKFTIDGREYEDYQLSNEQIVRLLESEDITDTEHEYLMKKVLERFKYDACKRSGEENEDLFARQFSDFVNGKCHDKKRVANTFAESTDTCRMKCSKCVLNILRCWLRTVREVTLTHAISMPVRHQRKSLNYWIKRVFGINQHHYKNKILCISYEKAKVY